MYRNEHEISTHSAIKLAGIMRSFLTTSELAEVVRAVDASEVGDSVRKLAAALSQLQPVKPV